MARHSDKDHPSYSTMIIPAYQNFLVLPTNINPPGVYKKALERKEHEYSELILKSNSNIPHAIRNIVACG